MDQILNRPEVQSAVLPFVVGLSLYLLLQKVTVNAWIWSVFTAFLISAGLINGLTVTPLTGTRKIILLVLASFIFAGFIYQMIAGINTRRAVSYVVGVSALLWVFWKVMIRMDAVDMALFLASGIGLVLWLIWAFERIGDSDTKLHGAGFSLLLGSGLSATAGASALLGQLALSMAVASGAVLLGWVLKGKATGSTPGSTLAYALAAALFGMAAVMFARTPWYALVPLASIPLATSLVPKISETRFTQALITSLPGLIIALATSFWVWQTGSSGSGY